MNRLRARFLGCICARQASPAPASEIPFLGLFTSDLLQIDSDMEGHKKKRYALTDLLSLHESVPSHVPWFYLR